MKRDLKKLESSRYDLLIIGGGITGAFAAWDATLRGLKVALVEKGDFGAATSSASGKIIHGGIRYMQYGALNRVRESLHERMIFQRIAPQFVSPIPFLIPTYGHFLRGKELLRVGMAVYDLLGLDKRNSTDPAKIIPPHRILSRKETLQMEPGVRTNGLTGGVIYYDCQMHNPERLTLSVLMAADEAGADLANYLQAYHFCCRDQKIAAVKVKDLLTNEKFEIKADFIINAAGPWAGLLLDSIKNCNIGLRYRYSKGIHIITRPITKNCAIAVSSRQQNSNSIMHRGGRHFFIIPWRNNSLIGTTNVAFDSSPDEKMVTEDDIQHLIDIINDGYPSASLKREDVIYQYGGLYIDDTDRDVKDGYQGARRSQIIDHSSNDGLYGLITAISVKYTSARKVAQKTIDLVYRKLGYKPPKCLTEKTSVYGGNISDIIDFISGESKKNTDILEEEITKDLVYSYGSKYSELLGYTNEITDCLNKVHEKIPLIKAQIVHAVRQEMAQKLTDVVFRRSTLGTVGDPGNEALDLCATNPPKGRQH
ncbi:FAD-dependent oxidoreductase [Thermodesulfobacteriota bacterium]